MKSIGNNFGYLLGLSERIGSYRGEEIPRHFYFEEHYYVKELSVFIDESGDFGQYEYHSPYYIVSLVFHDQSVDIRHDIDHLNMKFRESGLPDSPVHYEAHQTTFNTS